MIVRCPHIVRRESLTLAETTRGVTFLLGEKCIACGQTIAPEYALVEPFPGAGLPRMRGGDCGFVCETTAVADAMRARNNADTTRYASTLRLIQAVRRVMTNQEKQ